MKQHFLIITLLCTIFTLSAKADKMPLPVKTYSSFIKVLGGGKYDIGVSIVKAHDNGYVIAGRSVGTSGNMDMSLWKVDENGNVKWNYKFGDSETEEVYDIIQTKDGGYITVGSSDSYGLSVDLKDTWVVKISAQGKLIWRQTYGDENSIEEGTCISETEDGGFIIGGKIISLTQEDPSGDAFVLKIDNKGIQEWRKTYGGAKNDEAVGILPVDGGYTVIGNTESSGKGKWDVWMFNIDLKGTTKWERTYGGGDTEKANEFVQTEDGGFVFVGYSYTFAEASLDCWVVKTDKDGQQMWHKSFGGLSYDEGNGITATKDGGFAITGYTEVWVPDEYGDNTSLEGFNTLLIKIDSKGQKQWEKSIGGVKEQRGNSLVEAKNGDFIIVGSKQTSDQNNFGVLLIRTNSNGSI
ncbi:hypothetical protein EI427_10180 [Flammeovirga pectinis]|uniref:T9SS C-terminal target domain-containing protein n=1 Tax=Flammeovirga pectinis TaxID=2494373 RepID=A0A3S9P302_9BACT|nr:hypothetical protein [Flammeovirga pectinis]AZQ62590.1 hypothetical protein EI427_10180 [Flammeovirga pectinis]